MPIERAASPRNGVERAIAAMATSPKLPFLDARSQFCGAEWWAGLALFTAGPYFIFQVRHQFDDSRYGAM
jgi:hypothetical protein